MSKRIPVASLAISLGIALVAAFTWWTGRPVEAPSPTAARGGQLTVAIRTDPRGYNRLVVSDETSDLLALLTQARLVRINRSTFQLEPMLAESWESSADGRTHTVRLRDGLTWSDGTPLTAADVTFSLDAALDPKVESAVRGTLTIAGQPIRASTSDPRTIVLHYPASSGPGLRLFDAVPILPRHKLASYLAAGTLRTAWTMTTPPAEIVGAGPFVVSAYTAGERVVLERNPRYWRTAADGTPLPYLDRLVLEIVPEQNAAMLRLQAGTIDLTQNELRPEDYVAARRAEADGTLTVVEIGVGTDADAFWFLLKPEAKKGDPRFAFVQKREFRQALSHAVDREEFAQLVYQGAAVPIWGPVTPGNRTWFTPNLPRYPPDQGRARTLLASIGLQDRDGNGVVEDAAGTEARFTVITQRGVTSYERGLDVLQLQLKAIGIAIDIAPLEGSAMIQRMLASDYDAIYMRPLLTDLDPAGSLDLWLSSGGAHFWNLAQRQPATEWEKRIDTLMIEQAATLDPARRRELFDDVQRIVAEELPVLHFVAPRLYLAHSARVLNVTPSVMRPPALWNADSLAVSGPPPAGD